MSLFKTPEIDWKNLNKQNQPIQIEEDLEELSDIDLKITYLKPKGKERAKPKTCKKKDPYKYLNFKKRQGRGDEGHLGLSGPPQPVGGCKEVSKQTEGLNCAEIQRKEVCESDTGRVVGFSNPSLQDMRFTDSCEFSLSNTSFVQGYDKLQSKGTPMLYENSPKPKIKLNPPKKTKKRAKKTKEKQGSLKQESTEADWERQKVFLKQTNQGADVTDLPPVIETPIYSVLQLISKSEVELCQSVYQLIKDQDIILSTQFYLNEQKQISVVAFKCYLSPEGCNFFVSFKKTITPINSVYLLEDYHPYHCHQNNVTKLVKQDQCIVKSEQTSTASSEERRLSISPMKQQDILVAKNSDFQRNRACEEICADKQNSIEQVKRANFCEPARLPELDIRLESLVGYDTDTLEL